MGREKRPRITQDSLDRLDRLLEREFGVDPSLVQYEGKVQLLMGRFDADEVYGDQDDQDEIGDGSPKENQVFA